ncbi:MAG: UDP-glucose/GDP-mannose dehydrogenase family protein [Nanoarchaeota archaeon]|nr:UDP-glucose/GDP-mannose dehydrogenase family protein [Nanoarchaeota archaeon]
MNITVIGTGYVGLTTGVCMASKGHKVYCVDISKEKIDAINSGTSPIYEEGMDDLLKQALKKGLLKATLDAENSIKDSEVVFICVGTPSREDGSINLDYIKTAAETVSQNLNNYKVIVVKSTVVPGTTVNVVKPVMDKSKKSYGLCMNPEFLKEGTAVKDFLEGDRIVLGVIDDESEDVMRKVYKDFPQKIFVTNPTTAEMIKYANNSLLAAKISFANEVGNVCKKLGINVYEVMDGVGMDKRLCRSFLNAGIGFGGSCFPKDVKALISKGEELKEPMTLLKSVISVNEKQPIKMVELLKKHLNPANKKIGLLGLAFKKGTDDVREAPSLKIIDELLSLKAEVIAYDPEAMSNVKKIYNNKIILADNKEEVVKKSDAVLIITDWDEFKVPELYKNKIVIDGRKIKTNAEIYEGICW